MSAPTVTFEFEFGIRNGQPLYITAIEGRDLIAMDAERIKIEAHPDPDTVEETIVNRADLAYTKFIKRTVQPEPTIGQSDITLVEARA